MEFKIKKTLLIITSVLFITSAVFPQSKININNLVQYGDKWFKENDDKPFTGIVFDMSKATGNKILEAKYVQGFPHGKHAEWNNDGKKKVDGNYKSGVMNGKWTYYTKVGNCKYEINYKAGIYTVAVFTDNLGIKYTGQPITDRTEQDGIYLRQEENEYDFSKFPEFFGTLNDGKKDGLWTYWYENGEKIFEGTYINGKENGLWHWWYNNGKKRLQGSFSNGEKTGEWLFCSTNDEPMSYNQEFSTKIYSSDGRMLDKLFNESKDLNPINSRNDEKNNHNIQGFVEYVRNSLRNKDLNIYRYGYNIHTSLDFRLQQIANESMMESVIINQKKMVSENNDSKNISLIQCAFIALDPITGSILAMIGGRSDYQDKLNRAVQSKRQPGSVFNLFVYTTALDNGYPVTTQLLNQPVVLNVRNADGELVKWMPKNYDGSTGGLTTFREGIRKSLNLIPVRMVQQDIAPAEQVKQMAKRLGINTDIWVGDAIALGTSEVYPLEIVSAYSVLANKGVYSKPFAITKIEDRYGNVIKEYFPNRKEVMNEETAYLMTSLMQTVMDRGTGGSARWKYNFKRPAAGKTGTTQLWTDAWFIGFTPQIAAGCWFGIDDFRDSLGPGQDGSKVALPAWARFMKVAHDTLDLEIKKFEKPAGIIDKEICSVTKKVPLSACPVEVEIFKSRTEPTQKCKVHR
jgi:antitoxin component YwqK of YwqJK toxin-antitoxin module